MIRPTNVYGPDSGGQQELLLFIRLLRGRPILLPGDGNSFLHLGHVDDVAAVHVAVLSSPRALGEAFHIGDRYAVTQKGLVEMVARIAGKEPNIVHIPVDVAKAVDQQVFPFARRPDGIWRWSAIYSIQKCLDHLDGWKPKYDTESGLRQYFQWIQENKLDQTKGDFTYEDEILRRLNQGVATPRRRSEG